MTKRAKDQTNPADLIRRHNLHIGAYARVAKKLGMDPSYVSRVTKGRRKSDRILNAVVAELRRIEQR